MPCYLGLDLGTSGVRAALIDENRQLLCSANSPLPASIMHDGMLCQQPKDWWLAVVLCIRQIAKQYDLSKLKAIAIDGTSSTTLLTDAENMPVSPALMYNDSRPATLVGEICKHAPATPACSQSSALVKAVWLYRHFSPDGEYYIQQQADWVLAQFIGIPGNSDWNNALKLGFDPEHTNWPEWLSELDLGKGKFPTVFQPGNMVATINSNIAKQLDLPLNTRLHAGTTDSIAAFIASGAQRPGEATSSLGSTLVLKLCTTRPITSNKHGIYSHRLDENRWLAGGASNSGGAVLKSLFTNEELLELSKMMNTETNTGLNYYPLPATGERFPYPDPDKTSFMTPVPNSRVEYLQAIFEGVAKIEKTGYDLLEDLSGTEVVSIRSSGGGASNPAWTRIRKKIIARPFAQAAQTEAAYGSAILAAGRL